MYEKDNQKITEIIQILQKTVSGKYAIALAGAHAKGVQDTSSDIDIYVFAEKQKSFEERLSFIKSIADEGTSPWIDDNFESTPWGGSMDFMYQGTPIEVVVRSLERMDSMVEAGLKGQFEIIPATWTSNGYYTFIYLSELSFLKPIYDPYGIIDSYHKQIEEYPEALRQNIINTFLGRADTWLYNFHYESAIQRADVLFIAPIVQHTILDFVQVIFAINRVWFPGDKKLEKALHSLPYCPKILLNNLDFLLSTSRESSELSKQRDLLRRIRSELSSQNELIPDTLKF